jgi:hypothetical protein
MHVEKLAGTLLANADPFADLPQRQALDQS